KPATGCGLGLCLRVSYAILNCELAGGVEYQSVADFFVGAKHHQQAGTLIRNLNLVAGYAVANGFAGFVHSQHVTYYQAVACALVDGNYVELADLANTAWHVKNVAVDLTLWLAGYKNRVDCQFLGFKQAVGRADFLSAA